MRTIKKYTNRRLYDTRDSRYVNLEELAALIRSGDDLRVLDARTGEDLTRGVLMQVILDTQGGLALFPVGLLHRVIRHAADNPMQQLVLKQMGAGLEMLDVQMGRFEEQWSWMKTAGGAAASSTDAAATADPGSPNAESDDVVGEPPEAPWTAASTDADGPPMDDDLESLRARLAGLEARLDADSSH